jgi:hypothetical protein
MRNLQTCLRPKDVTGAPFYEMGFCVDLGLLLTKLHENLTAENCHSALLCSEESERSRVRMEDPLAQCWDDSLRHATISSTSVRKTPTLETPL